MTEIHFRTAVLSASLNLWAFQLPSALGNTLTVTHATPLKKKSKLSLQEPNESEKREGLNEGFFTSSPIKFLPCFMWHSFFFEGYKSTPMRKNKPRPHSTVSIFNTSPWLLLFFTFYGCFLFTGYQLVSEISDSDPGAMSLSSLSVIYCNGGRLRLFLRVTTDNFKWE